MARNGGPPDSFFAGAAWKVRQQEMEGRQAFSSSGNRAAPEIPAIGRKHPMRREEAAGGEKPDQGMRGERITEHSLETIGSR